MKKYTITSSMLMLLAASTSAWAAATAEEAERITATLRSYLGSEPGVVTVAPKGDGYDIALDAMPFLKKITIPGFTAAVDAYRFHAVPQGNGLWAVTGTGPYKAAASIPDTFKIDLAIPKMEWSGTYNDALQTFTDQQGVFTGMTINQETIDPTSKMKTTAITAIESMTIKGTATDAGNGAVNGDSTFDMTGIVNSSSVEAAPGEAAAGGPGFSYVATIAKASSVSKASGMTIRPITDLMAFMVAHPSKESLIKDQAILKEKMFAVIPVFSTIEGSFRYDNISIDTAMGKFGLSDIGASANFNGLRKEGRFAEGITLNGLSLPDGLPLPPWSKGLVPKSLKIGFDVSGFDAEAPARKFITEMDVTKPDPVPPGSEMAYLAAFAPTNSITLTIPPGEIASELYSLTYEGSSNISLAGGLPQVSAKFRMTGMDKVVAALQQAGADPTAQQAMAGLIGVKGMAKADGDALVWDVSFSPDGKLLVNGTDLSSMMGALGGPPPQVPAQ